MKLTIEILGASVTVEPLRYLLLDVLDVVEADQVVQRVYQKFVSLDSHRAASFRGGARVSKLLVEVVIIDEALDSLGVAWERT